MEDRPRHSASVCAAARSVGLWVSRTGTTKPFSDLNLAILGEPPLTLSVRGELTDAFTASDLPFKVDMVYWATTSATFRKIIENAHEVLQQVDGAFRASEPSTGKML